MNQFSKSVVPFGLGSNIRYGQRQGRACGAGAGFCKCHGMDPERGMRTGEPCSLASDRLALPPLRPGSFGAVREPISTHP